MLRRILPIVLVVLIGGAAVAATRSGPPSVSAIDRYFAASPVPDRIVLTWSADPATSIAVTWRTGTDVTTPAVQIVPADDSPHLERAARTVQGTSTPYTSENGLGYHHSVEITDLEPGTLFAYRVGGGEVWSEWFHHRTAGPAAEPFSFIYLGDAQNDIRSLWSRTARSAYAAAPDARFFVHAGDLVNLRDGNHDTEWGEWFGGLSWLGATLPSIPATGNHEYVKSAATGDYEALSPHWNHQFTLPRNGPEGLEGTVYHLDYQGVRFIVLNSLHALEFGSAEAQARWMEPLLRDNPNRWTVVVYHHPMYATRQGRDHPPLREHWKPLFDRYDVDVVLQGHDHAYGRGKAPALPQAKAGGPVYVVSVSGPKMYELGEVSDWAERRAENTQLYQVIHVDADRLRYEAHTVTGELYDAFDVVKNGDSGGMLVDRAPTTPERRGTEGRLPTAAR